ncbi:hypothetical protein HanPSC8_Chr03g0098481 [Helianthus annuus]|nr:hypothetical protein HanPSC8_Chr03g0098471 [Helianthus annuus]KAJ0942970.1 hypothetical protein HanPSC8_Chr03g0098481 [Helianthus annuus]
MLQSGVRLWLDFSWVWLGQSDVSGFCLRDRWVLFDLLWRSWVRVLQVKSCCSVRRLGSVDSVKPSQLGQHGQTESTQLTRSTQLTFF